MSICDANAPVTSCGSRIRAAIGPTVAGLLGGLLSGLVALPNMAPLCRNMAVTYDRYPSLQRPWLATDFSIPGWLQVMAVLVGLAGPVAVGAVAVWWARTSDTWEDISAGLSAAAAATLSAFAAGIGWPVVLALVVVPSIADLTLLSGDKGAGRSLVQGYPDLQAVDPSERGTVLMPKIISDQITGGAHAVWAGLLIASLSAGALALSGAMTAGFLRRRGDSLRTGIAPYLEVTLPLTVTIALVTAVVLTPAWNVLLGENPMTIGVPSLIGLAATATFMVVAVVQRWTWWLRVCLGMTWFLLLVESKTPMIPWPLPILGLTFTSFLIVRSRRFARPPVAVVA